MYFWNIAWLPPPSLQSSRQPSPLSAMATVFGTRKRMNMTATDVTKTPAATRTPWCLNTRRMVLVVEHALDDRPGSPGGPAVRVQELARVRILRISERAGHGEQFAAGRRDLVGRLPAHEHGRVAHAGRQQPGRAQLFGVFLRNEPRLGRRREIGRASCRER